ncbi:MAG TPA: DUF4132 domain-containing protein [Polyangiaceae bacterium]
MTLVWVEGERAAYAGAPGKLTGAAADRAFDLLLGELDKKRPLRASEVARFGDDKLEELAASLGPTTCDVAVMKLLLGRLGDAFAAQAVSFVRVLPRERFEAAMPIESGELVTLAATALFEQDVPSEDDAHYTQSAAERWLLRHAPFAANALATIAHHGIADASGCALAFLAAHGKASSPEWLAPFVELAPRVATSAALAVRAARGKIAQRDETRTAREPMPPFFDLAKLPRPALKDGGALSDDETLTLGDLLRSSTMLHPDPELAKIRFRCERASLDAFVIALLGAWSASETYDRTTWPLEACATLGSDDTAREVAKRVRAWTRTRGYFNDELAKLGCSVLALQAQHGSELARVLLDEIGRTGGRVRKEAAKLAAVVGVTVQEEEAKIPTLGLDATGSLAFDLGGATYRVVFDEALALHLADDSGARLAAFPRLRKGMDEKTWQTAKAMHAGMVKDAKTIARHELARLERMMCDEEELALASFRERYVEHPLLRHLGRRLVWSSGKRTFRVAEDGSFAGIGDESVTPGTMIQVAHPVVMTDDERRAWSERFVDYEIVQPFAQLAREIFVDAERSPRSLDALPSGAKTTRGRIFALVARGWKLAYDRIERELPDGASARVLFTGAVGSWSDEYVIDAATCTNAHRLPPITYSELMRDATYLRGAE